jgi:hypothetical protein
MPLKAQDKDQNEDEELFDSEVMDDGSDLSEGSEDGEEEYDDEDDEDDEGPTELAEDICLLMPSSLGAVWCRENGGTKLMEQEIRLREGQANDALEDIRVALAHRSLLVSKKLHSANSVKTTTRTWNEIRRADKIVRVHVKNYQHARQALIKLHAGMTHFRQIQKSDLKMSGDVTEEKRFGQRNDTLAWFWRLGGIGKKEENDSWMKECRLKFDLHGLPVTSNPTCFSLPSQLVKKQSQI